MTSCNEEVQKWPPGTVQLNETNDFDQPSRSILQPQPSSDPNDPLNWPQWRKYLNFGLTCLYTTAIGEFLCVATPTWGPMHEQLGFSYAVLNDSYAIGSGMLGLGSLVLIPLALKFGRRPVYLFSILCQFAITIWQAKMQSVADLLLVNALSCFFGAIYEDMVQMTIADVFFVHERGRMNTFYIWVFQMSSTIGPVIAGFITSAQGWRWVWWWNAVFFGALLVMFSFCYEETKYTLPAKDPVIVDQLQLSQSIDGSRGQVDTARAVESDKQDKSSMLVGEEAAAETASLSKGSVENMSTPIRPDLDQNIPSKTYLERLALTTTSPGGASIFAQHAWLPLEMLVLLPTLSLLAFLYGVTSALSIVQTTAYSSLMTLPPYNFTSSQMGLMSLAPWIGVTLGTVALAPFADSVALRMARRNSGIYEPEFRLWAALPFVVFVPVGALLYGFALSNHMSWVAVAAGMVLSLGGVAPINAVIVTYITDSYTEIVGDALVGVAFIRNVIGTSFVFALTPWLDSVGVQYVMVTMSALFVVAVACLPVMIKWGKRLRAGSASRYEYYVGKQFSPRV